MMKSWGIWSILAICCIWSLKAQTRRGKRLVNGVIVEEENHYYRGTTWYILLADGHECSSPGTWKGNCAKAQNVKCGGSLLTPSIVQTSCECLATFVGPQMKNFTRPCILKPWEKMLIGFLGSNNVETYKDGYLSNQFFIHDSCSALKVNPTFLSSYDYGFIKLQGDVKTSGWEWQLNYAPLYSISSLTKMWSYNLNMGVVCMTLGFGYFRIDADTNLPSTEKSQHMRQSWVTVHDYVGCYDFLNVSKDSFNYLKMATWVCMSTFPDLKPKSYLATGDFGGPVTCNNQYFAVASEGMYQHVSGQVFQFAAAIVFTPLENALEYRDEFMKVMLSPLDKPTFKPDYVTVTVAMMQRGFTSGQPAFAIDKLILCAGFYVINSY